MQLATRLAGVEVSETDDLVREAVCELANQIIGNSVTTLNDQGFDGLARVSFSDLLDIVPVTRYP